MALEPVACQPRYYVRRIGNKKPAAQFVAITIARQSSQPLAMGSSAWWDAFPFQHPDALQLSVSIPMSQRLFGQGAIGNLDKFKVTTKTH
jgi:hypothetical protein